MECTHKSSQGPASCRCHCNFFPLRVFRHLTLPSSPLLISSTSTSAGGEGGGARQRAPLCQMGSVDISHQIGADQRPACAHAGGRIKPHHAQPPLRKKEPLHTNKEIKSRVKSNSRGIVKKGPPPDKMCECDVFVSFVAC